MTPRYRTGTNGAPWVEYDSPKPPAVADHYSFWGQPPPLVSARCRWWLRQIVRGWRPPRRISGEGYDGAAQWYGVWMWEYFHLIDPALDAPLPGQTPPGPPKSAMDAWVRAAMARAAATSPVA